MVQRRMSIYEVTFIQSCKLTHNSDNNIVKTTTIMNDLVNVS